MRISDWSSDVCSSDLRTAVDLGNGTLAFGAFYNSKQLFHPIYEVIDQKSGDGGIFASLDLAGEVAGLPAEVTLGSQARFGTMAARQYVNVSGSRGALTADAHQTARTINSYGEFRIKPIDSLTLIVGGIHTSGQRKIENRLDAQRSGKATFDSFAPKFGMLLEPAEDRKSTRLNSSH